MFAFVRHTAAWTTRHAFPVVAGSVVAAAVAGGGVTYALTTHDAAASAPQSTPAPAATAAPHAKTGSATALSRALTLLAADSGQSVQAIRSELQSGRSLAAIAGPSAGRFEADLLARLKTALDKTVASGKISAAQETAKIAKATTTLNTLMAEPGTTLLQQGKRLQQFTHGHVAKAPPVSGTPTASPTP